MSGQGIAETFLRKLAMDGWTCKRGVTHCIERWANDYAIGQGYELGEGKVGILAADWNHVSRWSEETKRCETVCECMERVGDLAERVGLKIEWSDQCAECDECGLLLITEPRYYGWRPAYWVTDCEIYCRECADEHEIAATCMGNAREALPKWIEPETVGYHVVGGETDYYENGWHPGQNDEPRDVADKLEAAGIHRYVFVIGGIGQFDVRFRVAVRKRDLKRAGVALGFKPAEKAKAKERACKR